MTLNPIAKIPPFITRVNVRPELVSEDVLLRCYKGLKKRIKYADDPVKKEKLKMISQEIKLLINDLYNG